MWNALFCVLTRFTPFRLSQLPDNTNAILEHPRRPTERLKTLRRQQERLQVRFMGKSKAGNFRERQHEPCPRTEPHLQNNPMKAPFETSIPCNPNMQNLHLRNFERPHARQGKDFDLCKMGVYLGVYQHNMKIKYLINNELNHQFKSHCRPIFRAVFSFISIP